MNGVATKRAVYKPFGEATDWTYGATATPETKGFIGERYDPDTGLQYLNARYYDPKLAIFIQPDWWEVTLDGVGTNRFSYSLNDPINRLDPGGNIAPVAVVAVAALFSGLALGADHAADLTDGRVDGEGSLFGNAFGQSVFGLGSALFDGVSGETSLFDNDTNRLNSENTSQRDDEQDEFDDAEDEIERKLPEKDLDKARGPYKENNSKKGKDGDNKRQNNSFNDAVREIERELGKKMTKKQRRELHKEISNEGYGYQDIIDEGIEMFRD